jgi:hypothetical protein
MIASAAPQRSSAFETGEEIIPGIGKNSDRAHRRLKLLIISRLTPSRSLVTYPVVISVRYKMSTGCKILPWWGLSPW